MKYQNNERDMLQKNGLSNCPECKGIGWKVYEESNEETQRIWGTDTKATYAEKCPFCSGGLPKKVKEAKSLSNIPTLYEGKRLFCFDWKKYKDNQGKIIDTSSRERAVKSFISNYPEWKNEAKGLYIWSKKRGTGKTMLASIICNELMFTYGKKAKFISEANLISLERGADSESTDKYKKDPIKLYCTKEASEILVIDDLGQVKNGGEWLNNILFRIIDTRYQEKLVTIFTSNVEIERLDVDLRLTDRINRMSVPLHLPECAIRQEEARTENRAFLERMGLIDKNTA